jgi:hypothetical protein
LLSGYHLYAGRTGSFIVRDANQQALAYVYFEEEPTTDGGHCLAGARMFRPARQHVAFAPESEHAADTLELALSAN